MYSHELDVTSQRKDDRLGAEDHEAATFALVAETSGDPVALFENRTDGTLHVDIDSLMDALILQRADHFQSGPVADVG